MHGISVTERLIVSSAKHTYKHMHAHRHAHTHTHTTPEGSAVPAPLMASVVLI